MHTARPGKSLLPDKLCEKYFSAGFFNVMDNLFLFYFLPCSNLHSERWACQKVLLRCYLLRTSPKGTAKLELANIAWLFLEKKTFSSSTINRPVRPKLIIDIIFCNKKAQLYHIQSICRYITYLIYFYVR